MVFIEMQQCKGPGNKKFCNIHSKSSLDLRLALDDDVNFLDCYTEYLSIFRWWSHQFNLLSYCDVTPPPPPLRRAPRLSLLIIFTHQCNLRTERTIVQKQHFWKLLTTFWWTWILSMLFCLCYLTWALPLPLLIIVLCCVDFRLHLEFLEHH